MMLVSKMATFSCILKYKLLARRVATDKVLARRVATDKLLARRVATDKVLTFEYEHIGTSI